jgi:hypothetical protein
MFMLFMILCLLLIVVYCLLLLLFNMNRSSLLLIEKARAKDEKQLWEISERHVKDKTRR